MAHLNLPTEERIAIVSAIFWSAFGVAKYDWILIALLLQSAAQYAVHVWHDRPYNAEGVASFLSQSRPKVFYIMTSVACQLAHRIIPSILASAKKAVENVGLVYLLALAPAIYVGGWLGWTSHGFSHLASRIFDHLPGGSDSVLVYTTRAETATRALLGAIWRRCFPDRLYRLYMRAWGVEITRRWDYRPLVGGDRRIRLLRLHRNAPFAGVRGTIIHVALDDAPEYDAISYHWGTSRETRTIAVDGACFDVTVATHDALSSCSSLWRERLVWIDFLCINQQALDEKAEQVAMMKDIYQKARRVIVCLATSPLAAFVHPLLHELSLEASRPLFTGSDLYSKYSREGLSVRWLAMIEFLNLEWFSRIWIVQEVAVASAVQVRFAGWTYDWDYLISALGPLLDAPDMAGFLQATLRGRKAVSTLFSLYKLRLMRTTMIFVGSYRTAKQSRHMLQAIVRLANDENMTRKLAKLDEQKSPTPLGKLLETFRDFRATDPRDRVFALLGLMADDVPQSLAPRYDVPALDVFVRAARHVLHESDQGLFLLAFAGTGHSGRMEEGLPSWVPDWVNAPRAVPLTSYPWDTTSWEYAACGKSSSPAFIDDKGGEDLKLGLHCIRVDEVISLSETYEGIDDDNLVRDANGQYFHAAESIAARERHVSTLAMVKSRIPDPYPFKPGQPLDEAFWRTLIGDVYAETRPAPGHLGQAYARWAAMQEELMRYCQNMATAASLPTDESFWIRLRESGTFSGAMAKCVTGRRVCITRQGYIGCVPAWAEIGDEVLVIMGAKTPFLVRRASQDSKYRLVGESYLHGMMDGEVLEHKTEIETIYFR